MRSYYLARGEHREAAIRANDISAKLRARGRLDKDEDARRNYHGYLGSGRRRGGTGGGGGEVRAVRSNGGRAAVAADVVLLTFA